MEELQGAGGQNVIKLQFCWEWGLPRPQPYRLGIVGRAIPAPLSAHSGGVKGGVRFLRHAAAEEALVLQDQADDVS